MALLLQAHNILSLTVKEVCCPLISPGQTAYVFTQGQVVSAEMDRTSYKMAEKGKYRPAETLFGVCFTLTLLLHLGKEGDTGRAGLCDD